MREGSTLGCRLEHRAGDMVCGTLGVLVVTPPTPLSGIAFSAQDVFDSSLFSLLFFSCILI